MYFIKLRILHFLKYFNIGLFHDLFSSVSTDGIRTGCSGFNIIHTAVMDIPEHTLLYTCLVMPVGEILEVTLLG